MIGLDPPLSGSPGIGWTVGICVGLVAAKVLVFHYRLRDSRYTISFFEVVVCLAFARLSGGDIVLGVVTAALITRLARRQQRLKAAFNVAQFTLAACAAVGIRAAFAAPLPLDF